jgi:hypothetical protein
MHERGCHFRGLLGPDIAGNNLVSFEDTVLLVKAAGDDTSSEDVVDEEVLKSGVRKELELGKKSIVGHIAELNRK